MAVHFLHSLMLTRMTSCGSVVTATENLLAYVHLIGNVEMAPIEDKAINFFPIEGAVQQLPGPIRAHLGKCSLDRGVTGGAGVHRVLKVIRTMEGLCGGGSEVFWL
jgi:hypothetical protein